MKRLFIIDGHSMMYRSCYARMAELTSPDGEPTKGTYIFTRALLKMCRQEKPDFLVVAIDAEDSTAIRRKKYIHYKANRKKTGTQATLVIPQLMRMHQIVEALGICLVRASGYEADDIIATLTKRHERDVDEVVVVSRDKDLHQLVTERVSLFDPMDETTIGPAEVESYWGVPPSQVVEVQTLMGDATDNVPGVEGIGKVRAVQLIKKFGTAARAQKASKLSDAANAWRLQKTDLSVTRFLVELKTDVPVLARLEDFRFTKPDMKGAAPIFRSLGFQRWSDDDEPGRQPQAASGHAGKHKRGPSGPPELRRRGFFSSGK